MSTPTPMRVRLEHHAPGRLGIGERTPRISWRYAAAPDGFEQLAYRIEVVRLASGRPVTTVHEVGGREQVLVPWPAAALDSRDRIAVRVQAAGPGGWSGWSDPVTAEVGLLHANDWQALPVGPAWPEEADSERRPARVRSLFEVPGEVAFARLYLTGHGLVEAEINGERVGEEELTPGWTSYRHRLRYATFDVSGHVRAGDNAIGIWLADGWWRGRLGFGGGRRNIWGDDIAAIAQIEIVTLDGSRYVHGTDATWRAAPSPMLSSSLYDGESIDLRLHAADWSTASGVRNAGGWSPVRVHPLGTSALVAPDGPPVRCVQELPPVRVVELGDGRWLLDFGQNHSGRLRLRLPAGQAGRRITIRHSEVLDVGGELAVAPLRTAAATDRVVLSAVEALWEPRFTIHGYRYAEICDWPGELAPGQVVSRVLHTDMDRIGWFDCSDPLVNRLHENVVWGLRSNFVDVPTDCPQRDERLGWTGDIQVFAPTAAFLYDVAGLLGSWLRDLDAEQRELDWVPLWVPYFDLEPVASMPRGPSAVWGDAALLIPDVLHQRTGDSGVLRRQYASAARWLDAVDLAAGPAHICHDSAQLGDWLDPAAPPDDPAGGRTDRYLVATAYFAHAARRLSAMAAALGEVGDAERYGTLADDVARAYAEHYLRGGRAVDDAQTAYALTTAFGLWPDGESADAGAERLAQMVRDAGGAIGTGFAGTPALPDALSDGGHLEDAYALLLNRHCPSWLYAVDRGATTVWERWDGIRPDGTLNDPSMTSFNHYAFGAIADWLHRVVAGLAPAAPGYRRIRFQPRPGGGLTEASAVHDTPYGRAAIAWRIEGGHMDVTIEVPPGSGAELILPDASSRAFTHGTHRVHCVVGA